ncbi:unnamed protein product [Cochlearia groenlandica]
MGKKKHKKAARQDEYIPAHAKEMIQFMKVIVNRSDKESVNLSDYVIYRAFVDHRMNQSHALDHLLRLFQERSDAASSCTSGINAPQSSDLTNVETKEEPVISDEGVSSSNVPSSSSQQSNVEAKRVKVSSSESSSSEKQDDAPFSDDSSLHEKQDAPPCSVSKPFTFGTAPWHCNDKQDDAPIKDDSSLHEKQDDASLKDVSFFSARPTVLGSDYVYNKNYVAYNPLASSSGELLNTLFQHYMPAFPSNQDNNKNKNETYQVQSGLNDQASSAVTSLQQPSRTRLDDLAHERMPYDLGFAAPWLNPAPAISVPSNQIQMQNFSNFNPKDPTVMRQQEYERNLEHLHSALTFDQSLTETGTMFEPQMNQQAMNHHHYSDQPCEHYMPPSPFQQHGGSYNNTYHHQPLDDARPNDDLPRTATYLPPNMLPPSPSQQHNHGASYNINNNNTCYQQNPLDLARHPPYCLPPNMLPTPPFQQYGHGGGYNNNTNYHQQPLYDPMVPYMPRTATNYLPPNMLPNVPSSPYGLDNAANSRFGYANVLNNQQPPFQHQSGNSNVWAMPGYNQNQQQPASLRQPYGASLDQQNNTSEEPSNQNQPWSSWAQGHHNY